MTGKNSPAFLWLRKIGYFVPPTSDEIIHLQKAPGTLETDLKRAGVQLSPLAKFQDKNQIQLYTAELDGPTVLIGEAIGPSKTASGASDKPILRHTHKKAEFADHWKGLVETTLAAAAAWTITSILRAIFPDLAYLRPTQVGSASLVFGMILPNLYYPLQMVWIRNSTTSDWKMSWIVMGATFLATYLLLSPEASYWSTRPAEGLENVLSWSSDALDRNGLGNLRFNASTNSVSNAATQERLQELFSGSKAIEQSKEDRNNTWLAGFHPDVRDKVWVLRLILSMPSLPLGLMLFVSLQRHVKFLFQSRVIEGITTLVKVLSIADVVLAPILAISCWTPLLTGVSSAFGIDIDEARALQIRRALCVFIASVQLAILRPAIQGHLSAAKIVATHFLSLANHTENRGVALQANLRLVARTAYVVALEFSAIPFAHIALLLSRYWVADTIYIASQFIIWPISLLSVFVQSNR